MTWLGTRRPHARFSQQAVPFRNCRKSRLESTTLRLCQRAKLDNILTRYLHTRRNLLLRKAAWAYPILVLHISRSGVSTEVRGKTWQLITKLSPTHFDSDIQYQRPIVWTKNAASGQWAKQACRIEMSSAIGVRLMAESYLLESAAFS